jgi:serine/threonine protein kinase/tetratricopeptide (TPR) repeat protein
MPVSDEKLAVEDQPTLRVRADSADFAIPTPAPSEPLEAAARSYQHFLRSQVAGAAPKVDEWQSSFRGYPEHAQLFRDLHEQDPSAANRLVSAMTSMPVPGMEFLGFRLLAELGRGAFARVFLAEQEDLARRHVVLKLAADIWGEAQTLAQLHHPNIVPVYSVHHREPFHAVCMPFQGTITLQDLLKDVQQRDTLPTTGKYVIQAFKSAVNSRQRVVRVQTMNHRRPADTPPAEATPSTDEARIERLASLSYVETIVCLGAELADGLAHAHERGIVHHDLKPANVLLTDHGHPMLLDFNVAEDTKLRAGASIASVAGTLPYMAPEQIAAMEGGPNEIDARSDLYAFGIVMFELLTGIYPFTSRRGSTQTALEHMGKERRETPPSLQGLNPAVSPALEAIVRRCLESDPERRYQSARQLHEDLDRQRNHLPLQHTPEPSVSERLQKWSRRHPRLLATGWVAAIAAVLLLGVGAFAIHRGRELAELQTQERERDRQEKIRRTALAGYEKFQHDFKNAQFSLYTHALEPEERQRGLALGSRLLSDYGILDNPSWQQKELVQGLAETHRQQLVTDAAELMLLMARATLGQPGDEPTEAAAKDALRLNELAAATDSRMAMSPALWQQRGDLYASLGQDAAARETRKKVTAGSERSAQDLFLLASDHVGAGRLSDARPLLERAVWKDPQHYWAWFILGTCQDRLGQDTRAESSYTACVALAPTFPWSYFNRGLVHLRQQEFVLARADFTKVIELRPDEMKAYLNRASAHQGLKKYKQAEEDLSRALERGSPPTRLFFARANVREKLGDEDGARKDRAEGLRLTPTDEKSWVARGFALLHKDPQAALANFEEALRINPRSPLALQNKAYVLGDKLGRNKEALDVMNKAVELDPESGQAYGGRGVLLARLGDREAAIRDAEKAIARDSSPLRLYQIACIYALTSSKQPEDRQPAMQHLSTAVRRGFGFPLLETDPDLAPLRDQPEFRRLVDAARALQAPPSKKS